METPKIIAYLNPLCPWARGVLSILEKYDLKFDYRDVTRNQADFQEMVEKTGQDSSPCVEINGHMLADVGGEEVEEWIRQNGIESRA